MTPAAWTMLVVTWSVIFFFAGRFFLKVLRNPTPPEPDEDGPPFLPIGTSAGKKLGISLTLLCNPGPALCSNSRFRFVPPGLCFVLVSFLAYLLSGVLLPFQE